MELPFFTLGYLIHDKKGIITEKDFKFTVNSIWNIQSVINNFRSCNSWKIRCIKKQEK